MPTRVPPGNAQMRDLELLLKAHHPLLLIESVEHDRVETLLQWVADRAGLPFFSWTPALGLERHGPDAARLVGTESLDKALSFIEQQDLEGVFHLQGVTEELLPAAIQARVHRVYKAYFRHRGAVVVSGGEVEVPAGIEPLFTDFELAPPTPETYHRFVSAVLADLAQRTSVQVDLTPADVEQLLQALHGLTFFEVQKIITKAVIEDGRLHRGDLALVLQAKRRIIERSGVLEYFPHDHEMGAVAGLEKLKAWLKTRHRAFRDPAAAKSFGLTPPKGLLLIGVQGCGKSLCAKAVAAEWKLPLLRLDPSNLYQKYFGESERNLKRAIRTAESMAPVVLWIDEIEKALGQDDSDGGTSQRVFGTFLSWMQEKRETVFVIATANDISRLPPELLRKGRFDEIFFVDLPGHEARAGIFKVHLEKRDRPLESIDLDALAAASDGFSGAEIEQAVIGALYTSFSDGVPLSTEAILAELAGTHPLSVTMGEKVAKLRAWASERAVPAE